MVRPQIAWSDALRACIPKCMQIVHTLDPRGIIQLVILMGKSMTICMTIHDMFGFPRIFRHTPPIYCLAVRNYLLAAAHW